MEPTTQQIEETQPGQADVIVSLESLIKSHIDNIIKLNDEKRKKSEMVKDSYEGDPNYRELDKKAKDARKVASTLKSGILMQQSNKLLSQELKGIRSELKEKKEELSDYLLEYRRLTDATQLELFDGSVGDIVLSAKLVKRNLR